MPLILSNTRFDGNTHTWDVFFLPSKTLNIRNEWQTIRICHSYHCLPRPCDAFSCQQCKIRTTGLAGGLFKPYKGLLPALESKDSLKRFASRNIIYSLSPKGLYLFVTFYRLTRKRVYILLQRHLIIFKIFL